MGKTGLRYYDSDNGTTTYAYDDANRLVALSNPDSEETTFAYDAVGNRIGITRANGTYTSYTYNSRNWLAAMENCRSDTSVISSFAYEHDNAGNRMRMTENTGDYTTYSYDALYQLTGQTRRDSEEAVQWQYSYTYDPVGNRLTETDQDSNITTYAYNSANQLTTTVADQDITTYTYDANGSMAGKEDSAATTAYDYDYENRLTVVTHPDTNRTTFTYNADGKRLTKQDIAGLVEYTYDMDKVILERDGQAQTVAAYTHEGGSLYHDLISMHRSDSYYHLFDGLGSVTELVDADQDTQNSYRYEAFGQFKLADETVPNPYTYVGAFGVQWDAGTGLHFMQARYYASTIGRFISVDPFRGLSQDPISLHRYCYVVSNPVNHTDPFGLSSDGDFVDCIRRVGGWAYLLRIGACVAAASIPCIVAVLGVFVLCVGVAIGYAPCVMFWLTIIMKTVCAAAVVRCVWITIASIVAVLGICLWQQKGTAQGRRMRGA